MSLNFAPTEGNATLGASLFETWTNLEMLIEILPEDAVGLIGTPIGTRIPSVQALPHMDHRVFIGRTLLPDSLTLRMKTPKSQSVQVSLDKLIQL